MRYAVTGATGFVGGAVVRRLLADGHEVVAVVRNPNGATALLDLGVQVAVGDLSDIAAMKEAFSGADGVFHLAGWYKIGDRHPEVAWQVNVEGTANALQAAKESVTPRVVYTSTCAVNSDTHGSVVDESFEFTGRHISVYDETKAQAHDIARTFSSQPNNPDVVIVMPGGVYGPGDTSPIGRYFRQIASGKRVVASAKLRVVEAHVDDVAAGHVLAMEKGVRGDSYMLAGERTDLLAMLSEVAMLTGGPQPINVPSPMLPVASRLTGILGKVVPLPTDYSSESLRVSQASYLGTAAKAHRELGWKFRPLHQGLRETLAAEGLLPD